MNIKEMFYKYNRKVIIPSMILCGVGLLGYLSYSSSKTHEEFMELAALDGDEVVDNSERAKVYDVLERDIPIDLETKRQYINRVGE